MSDLSPYVLPEGNVQIAFSGGRTSAYMLHQILEANGGLPGRVEVTFQNTGREMPETLEFVAEVGRRWGVMITWLEYRAAPPFFEQVGSQAASRNGEPFEALIERRKFLPNQVARFCTIELKVRTAKRYLRSLGWDYWTNCVGLRADEPHRLNKPAPKDRWTVWTPLATAGVSRHDVAAFWRAQSFDLQLANIAGSTPLGNCDGCFLKSEANVAALARDFPDRHAWWERMERRAGELWFAMTPWARLRRLVERDPELVAKLRGAYAGRPPRRVIESMVSRPPSAGTFSKRYSRAELRRDVERKGPSIFELEGYFCQASGGECTG